MATPFVGSQSDVPMHKLRAGSYDRVTRDVYVEQHASVDLLTRCEAVQLLHPEAVMCLFTSALLLGLPVDDDGLIHFDRGLAAARTIREGMTSHRFGVEGEHVMELHGLRVSDGPTTMAQLSSRLSFEPLVAVGDVLARRWPKDALEQAVTDHGKRRGAVLFGTAVPLLDGGSDSPAETRARLRLHAEGFTAFQHEVVITDDSGNWLLEPDLADPSARIAIQHEGAIHFELGIEQWRKDLARDDLAKEFERPHDDGDRGPPAAAALPQGRSRLPTGGAAVGSTRAAGAHACQAMAIAAVRGQNARVATKKKLNPLLLLPILVVHVLITRLTWFDLTERAYSQVRGSKKVWKLVSGLNTGGSLAYAIGGRRG